MDVEIISISSDSSTKDDHGSSFANSPIVVILVGKFKVEYTAHKQVLIDKCPFFAGCLASGMKEAITNVVKLPEDKCEAMDQFIAFIYSGQVNTPDGVHEITALFQAWILAEKFCMTEWQNKLIDSLMKAWGNGSVVPQHLSLVFDNVTQSSPLFKLVFDQLAYDISRLHGVPQRAKIHDAINMYRDGLDVLCTKEGFPVSLLMWTVMTFCKDPISLKPIHQSCKYHIHPEGEKCKTKFKDEEPSSKKRKITLAGG